MILIGRRSFCYSLAASALASQSSNVRPNVVIILADDMGWGDAGMNGCPDIATPNIDSISRQGVRLMQFYANAPECTPTRCALLTGRYPHRVGGLECAIGVNNIGRYDEAAWLQKKGELGLPVSELTMPRILKDVGYDTACIGKWHLGYLEKFWPGRHGFDHTFMLLGGGADYYTHAELNEGEGQVHLYDGGVKSEKKGYLTDLFTEDAVSWLRKTFKRKTILSLSAVYRTTRSDTEPERVRFEDRDSSSSQQVQTGCMPPWSSVWTTELAHRYEWFSGVHKRIASIVLRIL